MENRKKNIILVPILICIFLCVCAVCIYVIIPKCLIKLSNDERFYNYGDYRYTKGYYKGETPYINVSAEVYTYGDVFYAKIENIENISGRIIMYVDGLEINDINHRSKYSFAIDDTKLFWRHKEIKLTDLKKGQNVSITSIGTVEEGYPARLTKVARIILLEDEL